MKRVILMILDGFGIGSTRDAATVRPQDIDANTCKHILQAMPNLKLANLEKLGLMNALGEELGNMKMNPDATFGFSNLAHFGADTFYGHQEIMGTKPIKPIRMPFSEVIDKVYDALVEEGYEVQRMGDHLKYLLVNGYATVADNLEADLGSAYNVTAALDFCDFTEVTKIGRIVRRMVEVSRVIAFGGREVAIENILSAVEEKEAKYIGINAPESGVYNKGYKVIHLGYGVEAKAQVPTILGRAGINVTLIGKVADIVENDFGKSISCVDTEETLKITSNVLKDMESGFVAVNVQETDLAGHAQDVDKYASKLLLADRYLGSIMKDMHDEDILIVMADHGNDPTIGHSHHTRENVPVLIYGRNVKKGFIGYRGTLSDVGATIAEYFNCTGYKNGTSFLKEIL